MSSDAAIIDVLAARGGDRDAFARLVDGYRNVVCSITLAIARDVHASEDLAQDVFVAAWTGLGPSSAPGPRPSRALPQHLGPVTRAPLRSALLGIAPSWKSTRRSSANWN